jgi:hypothetical protein
MFFQKESAGQNVGSVTNRKLERIPTAYALLGAIS